MSFGPAAPVFATASRTTRAHLVLGEHLRQVALGDGDLALLARRPGPRGRCCFSSSIGLAALLGVALEHLDLLVARRTRRPSAFLVFASMSAAFSMRSVLRVSASRAFMAAVMSVWMRSRMDSSVMRSPPAVRALAAKARTAVWKVSSAAAQRAGSPPRAMRTPRGSPKKRPGTTAQLEALGRERGERVAAGGPREVDEGRGALRGHARVARQRRPRRRRRQRAWFAARMRAPARAQRVEVRHQGERQRQRRPRGLDREGVLRLGAARQRRGAARDPAHAQARRARRTW